jgi:hypothetical protein
MNLPWYVLAIRDRYVAALSLWTMPEGPAAEDRARQWTLGLIAQVVYERPGEGYGSKRADPTRPLSKDGLARDDAFSHQLLVWDLLAGAGSGRPTLVANPESHEITGQVFVEIPGRDVLGGQTPTPPIQPPKPAYPGDPSGWELGRVLFADYAEAGRAVDPGIGVWFFRTAWDAANEGLTMEQSIAKHRAEWREILGV